MLPVCKYLVKFSVSTGACAVIAAAVLDVGRLEASPLAKLRGYEISGGKGERGLQGEDVRILLVLQRRLIHIHPAR